MAFCAYIFFLFSTNYTIFTLNSRYTLQHKVFWKKCKKSLVVIATAMVEVMWPWLWLLPWLGLWWWQFHGNTAMAVAMYGYSCNCSSCLQHLRLYHWSRKCWHFIPNAHIRRTTLFVPAFQNHYKSLLKNMVGENNTAHMKRILYKHSSHYIYAWSSDIHEMRFLLLFPCKYNKSNVTFMLDRIYHKTLKGSNQYETVSQILPGSKQGKTKTLLMENEYPEDFLFFFPNSRFISFSLSDVAQTADSICLFETFEMIVICPSGWFLNIWGKGYPAIMSELLSASSKIFSS